MSRDYYTYGEIVLALRKYFQETQKKLNEMKEKVIVESKEPCDYNLTLQLEHDRLVLSNGEVFQGPDIYLDASKNYQANIGTYSRYYLNKINGSSKNYFKDNVRYKMTETDNKYLFDYIVKYYPGIFKPKAYIPDSSQEEFGKFYHELKELPLYNTRQNIIDINPYQRLWFTGDGVNITNSHYNNPIYINYVAKDDKIHVETKKRQDGFFLERLLNTQIPMYMLSYDLVALLEGNYVPINKVALEDGVRRESSFDFNQEENELVLKKVKK